MVVVDFTAEQLLHRIDDAIAAGVHSVDAVARMVPQCEADGAPFAVGASERLLIHLAVGNSGAAQQLDLLGIEERFDDEIAIVVIGLNLFLG